MNVCFRLCMLLALEMTTVNYASSTGIKEVTVLRGNAVKPIVLHKSDFRSFVLSEQSGDEVIVYAL